MKGYNDILVSIVVPAYNADKYLHRCIKSLCNQSHQNIEIIIVNDGSTDNTETIALYYQDKDERINVITQENKGLSGARNTGIDYAKGDYIGFVDSDDWIPSEYYERLLYLLLENKADIITTDLLRLRGEGEAKPVKYTHLEIIEEKSILNNYMLSAVQGKAEWMAVCSKLYKKEIIGDTRFEEGRIYEDIVFNWYVLKKAKKIVVVNGIYYYYYVNNTSITKTVFSNSVYDIVHAAEVIAKDYSGCDKTLEALIIQYRARADYSVFVRMIKGNCKDLDSMKIQQQLINKSFRILLFSKMPISRKIALIMFRVLPCSIILKMRRP